MQSLYLCEDDVSITEKKGSGLRERKDCCDVTPAEGCELTPSEDLKPLTASPTSAGYPFAFVLRLRVLQIVCGISGLVMGAVAFIEERGRIHLGLGLGMPAGVLTVAAAAASIHTSRGFGGYSSAPPSCGPPLRLLGPSARVAVPLTLLWAGSVLTHLLLTGLCLASLTAPPQTAALASVLLLIALLTLVAVALILSIDCRYDPD